MTHNIGGGWGITFGEKAIIRKGWEDYKKGIDDSII